MLYSSTRGGAPAVSSAQAIVDGLAPDGGLYVMAPDALPKLDWRDLKDLEYPALAARILSALLPDFSVEEAEALVRRGYSGKFSDPRIAPLVDAGGDLFLELFHGPTAAFKDVALCLLPHLMTASSAKCGHTGDILILTATSGDTGKAALEGFRDVDGIRILVFFPRDGVSPVQKAQMVTQTGRNVGVCSVIGNFDDAQTGVKRIFAAMPEGLSSANSINIGRLVPQVVYYYSAYFDALRMGRIREGEKLNYAVPTGNFGDILAGYLAAELGLPVGTLLCASNANNVLTDFIDTGVYDRRRPFHKTLSPSMDILISSNLERLLYLLSGDPGLVASLMAQLSAEGRYTAPDALMEKLRARFAAFCCDDVGTQAAIAEVWEKHHYLMDTHTAVAWRAAQDFGKEHGPTVILSTASPYKFPAAVLGALGQAAGSDEFAMMDALETLSGVPMPANLRGLRERPVLHTDCVAPADMLEYVKRRKAEPSWAK
ncbi:MAG: threonine synthase [Oscillospiraceae bacterium]|nr:threonine synthase [Oscillospiraceae bacterium]